MLNKKSDLWGIKYWAIWYPLGTFSPRYDICTYVGYDPAIGLHYFLNHKKKSVFAKNMGQIEMGIASNSFKPFLLDIKKMEEYINTEIL